MNQHGRNLEHYVDKDGRLNVTAMMQHIKELEEERDIFKRTLDKRDAELAETRAERGMWWEAAGKLRAENERLRTALAFYAASDTWFAVMLLGDSPCGDIMSDFDTSDDGVERPGKRARAALEVLDEQ